ncbi:DUF3887 domain-containing protein [Clostridium sp. Cult3]|jgi:uncharacterized lipoprotein YehR (DUF1307 family)|uniref:DUF3887 domain-containing protein n=1 Tax=Clostridium sp. Cult3 TaxID=2079004 RepID=UPI001F383D55|nr:DUF3887 domain-containing protein [Clostridium sp. Cult3]MCF6459547.1 DUF3887 domain-containing protein [Clostridium sp. Cult3]
MKRRTKIGLIALLLVCIFTLSACKKKELSNEFDQEQVEELAISVVDMVNKEDAEGIKAISNEEMKQAMTDDIFEQVFDMVKQFGEYKEVSEIDVTGVEDKASKEPIAVVVLKAKYTDKEAIYTISFDTDMKLVGLYVK